MGRIVKLPSMGQALSGVSPCGAQSMQFLVVQLPICDGRDELSH